MLALASGPIYGRKRRRTLVVGVVGRAGTVEGVLSGRVTIDGDDSSATAISMFRKSRFREQIRAIVLNGIAIAGLNVVDVKRIEKATHVPVLVLTRSRPNVGEFMRALSIYQRTGVNDSEKKRAIIENINKERRFVRMDGFYVQAGLDATELKGILPTAFVLLRLAHMIASGVSMGVSKGRM